jgi:hypothetical protein
MQFWRIIIVGKWYVRSSLRTLSFLAGIQGHSEIRVKSRMC